MNHDWGTAASVSTAQTNPTGIGNVFLLSDMSASGSNHRFTYNTPAWYQENTGKQYVFSAWVKSGNGEKIVLAITNKRMYSVFLKWLNDDDI